MDVPWAGHASRLALRFEREFIEYACAMPVRLASQLLRVGDNTIRRMIGRVADMGMREMDLSDLTEFCVDRRRPPRSQSHRHGHPPRYRAPHLRNSGEGFLRDQRIRLPAHASRRGPQAIGFISSDMSPSFPGACRDTFPNAEMVMAWFHVMRNANDMVDAVRRTCGIKGTRAKGLRFRFLRNSDTLDEVERASIEPVLEEYCPLGTVYSIKEAVRDFHSSRDTLHCDVQLRLIVNAALDSEVERMVRFGKMPDRHFHDITQWHSSTISNGVSEGNNSVIQAMKSSCRGFANIQNIINMTCLRSLNKGLSSCFEPRPGGI